MRPDRQMMRVGESPLVMSCAPNPAHALDGGIPALFDTARAWPAARDVRRWGATRVTNITNNEVPDL